MTTIDTLLPLFKTEVAVQGTSKDAELREKLSGALASFANATYRNLEEPGAGDPSTTVVRPVYGGVARLPDARSITTVEFSATRLAPTWSTATGFDAAPWFTEDTYVWLTMASDWSLGDGFVRVTGKFGMTPLPQVAKDAVITLAAHRWRMRGGEASGSWQDPDGQAEQSFSILPPSYMTTVRDLRVPQAPLSYLATGA